MSEVILYNSDCIQAMTEIADHSINLILTEIIIPSLIQSRGIIKKYAFAV